MIAASHGLVDVSAISEAFRYSIGSFGSTSLPYLIHLLPFIIRLICLHLLPFIIQLICLQHPVNVPPSLTLPTSRASSRSSRLIYGMFACRFLSMYRHEVPCRLHSLHKRYFVKMSDRWHCSPQTSFLSPASLHIVKRERNSGIHKPRFGGLYYSSSSDTPHTSNTLLSTIIHSARQQHHEHTHRLASINNTLLIHDSILRLLLLSLPTG
jgi:hypothetical protein